jgi:hypothetical protein
MQVRWYNPSLRGYEWRNLPEDDEEALADTGRVVQVSTVRRGLLEVAQSGGDRHGVAYPGR